MMPILLVSLLSWVPSPSLPLQHDLEIQLGLMYRRSAQTHLDFGAVTHGDTVHYYARQGNPYFRVYTIRCAMKVTGLSLESFERKKSIKKAEAISTSSSAGYQFVDTYINAKETHAKATVTYLLNGEQKEFVFYIVPDKKLF